MNYLFIAPQLGLSHTGEIVPGGLLQLGRCIARALASSPDIRRLGVWCQVDSPQSAPVIERMLSGHAHAAIDLDIRAFGGSRTGLIGALAAACARGSFDRVMYGLVNQAQLSVLPRHPPHDAWLIGIEVFTALTRRKLRSLQTAQRLLSISRHTAETAALFNDGLERVQVVPLCVEPCDSEAVTVPYQAGERAEAVLIVGNIHRDHLYKGHQQLISAWRQVTAVCPGAQLWIAGHGDGEGTLKKLVNLLPLQARKQIQFLGKLDPESLDRRLRRARVFAMPSTGEGFGLVFVEAARYGLPCIGGLYDSVKEIVIHGETGLLVEQHPHDIALACLRLLTDPALAKQLGEAGRRRCLDRFLFPHFRNRLLDALGFAAPSTADPLSLDALCAFST